MYIHEAIDKALKKNMCITRTDNEMYKCGEIKLKPTNTDDCIICISKLMEKSSPRWNPKADDLISDKWIVV